MKNKGIFAFIIISALVFADQFSKLLARAFAPSEISPIIHFHTASVWLSFSFYPELHDRWPLPADIVMAVFGVIITSALIVYFKYERAALFRDIPGAEKVRNSPKMTFAAVTLWTAGIVCSVFFDAFLWGGSLDFLCFDLARLHEDNANLADFYHLNIDFKDIFAASGTLLILLRMAIRQISLFSLEKSDRKLISKREFHFIRSIREARNAAENSVEPPENTASSDVGKKLNNIFDAAVIAVGGVVFSLLFGYAIYVFAVWLIIPIAVEIIPALDGFLTKIGDSYETEAIYGAICSFCMIFGIFPGIWCANLLLKSRERRFIHDTNGMVLTCDALKFHFSRYAVYDSFSVVAAVAACLVLWLSGHGNLSPFGFLYDFFGIPAGLALSAVITASAQLLGVINAQKTWRAEYFYGE